MTVSGDVGHFINGKLQTERYQNNTAEADAWAQAPTLEALMLPLMDYMRKQGMLTITAYEKYGYNGRFSVVAYTPDGKPMKVRNAVSAKDNSLPLAIASLFIEACDAGLIDGKAVVL
jgi:hypothetical protein